MEYEIFRIVDIFYTGNIKGKRYKSKVGAKYDKRRGHLVNIDINPYSKSNIAYRKGSAILITYDDSPGFIVTTPFVEIRKIDDRTIDLETENSIYRLEGQIND